MDADAIGRLLAVTTDAAPAQPQAQAGIDWRLAADGSHRYEPHGSGDTESDESKRALYAALKTALGGPETEARAIAAANQEVIMLLPEKGRDALLTIIERRGLANE